MDANAIPDAAKPNPDEPLAALLARKAREAVSKALLEQIKIDVLQLDPVLDRKCLELRLAVVLIAARWVGPDIDRLVSFTHYSRKFVEVVSSRMRAAGRWTDDKVHTDHWYEGDKLLPGRIWLDCLIADGAVEVGQAEDGEEWFRAIAKH
jgi:hypothetical protein